MTRTPRGKALLVAGYYGYGNLGDEAIRIALRDVLSHRMDLRVRWLVARPRDEDEVARMSPFAILSALRVTSALVLGGGGLLQNRTSTRSLLYYLGLLFAARLLRHRVFLLGQGIGPITGRLARRLTRQALAGAAFLGCRDRGSLGALRELGLTGTLGGDLFFLEPPPAPSPIRDETQPRIVFCLKGLRATAETAERYAEVLRTLRAARPGISLDLLPFFPVQDLPLAREIATRLGSDCGTAEAWTVEQALAVIADADLVVSSRLHPLEFALRTGTPFLGVPADPKIPGFLDEVRDLGGPVIPCETFPSAGEILRALDAPPGREELRAVCQRMHERTGAAFEAFLHALDERLGGNHG